MLFYLYTFLVFQLGVAFSWPVSYRSIEGTGDTVDGHFPQEAHPRPAPLIPRWILESNALIRRNTTNNATNNLVDPAGNDISDGDITNEDVGDILNDRYGLLAVVLGVAVVVLLFSILLVLLLAYREERKGSKYKELSGSDDNT